MTRAEIIAPAEQRQALQSLYAFQRVTVPRTLLAPLNNESRKAPIDPCPSRLKSGWPALHPIVLAALMTSGCQAYDRARLNALLDAGDAPADTEACVSVSCSADSARDAPTFDAANEVSVSDVSSERAIDATVDAGGDAPFDVTMDQRPDTAPVDAHIVAPPVFRSIQAATLPSASGCCLTITRPSDSVAGDVLLATIAMGVTSAPVLPTMTPPAGWTLVRRIDHMTSTSLWIYWHVATATEPANYLFQTDRTAIGGVGWIGAYNGVDQTNPIDSEHGVDVALSVVTYTAPSITTVHAQTMLVATYVGHGGASVTWTGPAGMVRQVTVNDGSTRSGTSAEQVLPAAGTSGAPSATASATQDYAIVDLLALAPTP